MSTNELRTLINLAVNVFLAVGCGTGTLSATTERGPASIGVAERGVHACTEGPCGGLGNTFYLPSRNALSVATGGRVIFKDRHLGSCVVHDPDLGRASRSFRFVTSTENFYAAASAETNIEGSYDSKKLSFAGSLEATTGYSESRKESIQSLALDVTYTTGVLDFVEDSRCISEENLDAEFLAAFRLLPGIVDPSVEASWIPYISFLKAWGSHVIVQQVLGSRFQQWESVLESQEISQSELQVKACAEVEGTGKGDSGWSVSGCAAYSDEQKREALKTETKQSHLIIGGTEATRKALLKDVTKETLDAFVDAADEADQAVTHEWLPIWTLMARIVGPKCQPDTACPDFQRVINLEAAYEGWLGVGCPKISARGVAIQSMIAWPPFGERKTYWCLAAKEGCLDNDDCHLGGAGSVCYCYGAGCIARDLEQPVGDPRAPSSWRNGIRSEKVGSYDKGVNNSCTYRFGAYCGCNPSDVVGLPARTLWRQGSAALGIGRSQAPTLESGGSGDRYGAADGPSIDYEKETSHRARRPERPRK